MGSRIRTVRLIGYPLRDLKDREINLLEEWPSDTSQKVFEHPREE